MSGNSQSDDDLRDLRARVAAESDQARAAALSPDVLDLYEPFDVALTGLADALHEKGMARAQVLGLLSGRATTVLAVWLYGRF